MEEIKKTVNLLIEEVVEGLSVNLDREDALIKEEIGVSSLQYIVLALRLEEEYGQSVITVDNIGEIKTLSDLYSKVAQIMNTST